MHSTESRKLNDHEAAEYVGLSISTLSKRRVFGGGPKYLKLGRRVVYDTRDLDDWLDSHRRTSTSDAGNSTLPPGRRPRNAGTVGTPPEDLRRNNNAVPAFGSGKPRKSNPPR